MYILIKICGVILYCISIWYYKYFKYEEKKLVFRVEYEMLCDYL